MEVIKSGKKHNSVSQPGWTCEIPSKASCRIFMINDEQTEGSEVQRYEKLL